MTSPVVGTAVSSGGGAQRGERRHTGGAAGGVAATWSERVQDEAFRPHCQDVHARNNWSILVQIPVCEVRAEAVPEPTPKHPSAAADGSCAAREASSRL